MGFVIFLDFEFRQAIRLLLPTFPNLIGFFTYEDKAIGFYMPSPCFTLVGEGTIFKLVLRAEVILAKHFCVGLKLARMNLLTRLPVEGIGNAGRCSFRECQ